MSGANLILETFKKFIVSDNSEDMFVTGVAGTGKTTDLCGTVQYCMDNGISHIVCAFTHDACKILRSKLPKGANVQTLHKFIKKRPSVNTEATKYQHVTTNSRFGTAEEVQVLFVDEYSQVGEKDLMDIRELQDNIEDEEGEITKAGLRVCWLGDPHQLPPVGDAQAIQPHGKFSIRLTKQYRQIAGNPLSEAIAQLISFIEGKPAAPLLTSAQFKRGQDIKHQYIACKENKILLAFTNQKVQDLNWTIEGKEEPEEDDIVFSPSTKQKYTFIRNIPSYLVYEIDRAFGEPLKLGSKYKTLEFLIQQDYKFCEVEDEEGQRYTFAYIFGHYEYKKYLEDLKRVAAGVNKTIMDAEGMSAAQWAKANPDARATRDRAYAWRKFLSFNECIICLDFAHAKTIHKAQGSTYHTVFLDSEDLGLAAETNYTLYLKLMYVALSRATNNVITN